MRSSAFAGSSSPTTATRWDSSTACTATRTPGSNRRWAERGAAMKEPTYENFDLLIEGDGGAGYRARVLDSPVGETQGVPVQLPFSDLEIENFLLKVGRPRRGGTRGESAPEVETVRTFGSRLFEAVFPDELRDVLQRSIDEMEGRDNVGLRLRLRPAGSPGAPDPPRGDPYHPHGRADPAPATGEPPVP